MKWRVDSFKLRRGHRLSKCTWVRGIVSVLCLFLLFVPGNEGLAVGETVLATEPSTASVRVNGLVSVDLVIRDVEALYGVDVALSFDPTVVAVVDADPSRPGVQIQAGEFPHPDFVVYQTADNAAGTIRYAVTQLNPREAVSGSGVLAIITFAGLRQGETGVVYDSWLLADRRGTVLPALAHDGVVRVGDTALCHVYLPVVAR